MLFKIITVLSIIGLAYSAALDKDTSSASSRDGNVPLNFGTALDFISLSDSDKSSDHAVLIPTALSLVSNGLTALVGYKAAALSLAVKAIGWIVSNVAVIIFGAFVTLGFCKITGKCSLDYHHYGGVAQFRSLVTPERLETAQNFLASAVEKYAKESKKRKPIKKAYSNNDY